MVKHLVSIDDLSTNTIEKIFELADRYSQFLKNKQSIELCKDKIMATLFYEPSTRTRMSFESAMYRLGGKIITSEDTRRTSSAAKGESIVDTIKVIQYYADLIIMRHFNDGSTMLAAENSDVPIISGGDGTHEHPTQTLCDLYTIKRERKKIKGLNIALCGDLKYGRTVHSLAYGLAKFGANIFSVAPSDFELPEYVEHRLKTEYNTEIRRFSKLDEKLSTTDVIYLTQARKSKKIKREDKITIQTQTVNETEGLFPPEPIEYFDAVYVTRIQMERMQGIKTKYESMLSYLINKELLEKAKKDTIVMHPLPRRDELSYDIDQDKRAAYFRQAAYGVPIRMALITSFLGLADFDIEIEKKNGKIIKTDEECSNANCITKKEKHTQNKLIKVNGLNNVYRCFYCDQEKEIKDVENLKDQDQIFMEK